MIHSLEIAAYFILFFFWIPCSLREGGTVDAVKSSVVGRRRGGEEEKRLEVLPDGGRTDCKAEGLFCWDQHCEKGFVQKVWEGCFRSTEV